MVSKTIRTLTKKDLRLIFSESEKQISTKTLRRKFITNDFIKNKLGLTFKAYRCIKQFNYEQTQIIIEHFKIEADEIN